MTYRKRHVTFAHAVEHGAKVVGGQNALARAIGVHPANLANAKRGRATVSAEAIERLALLVDAEPAHLWHLCHLARLPARNPFLPH